MKYKSLLAIPVLSLLASCAGTGAGANAWTHASLDDVRRQQEFDRCTTQAMAVEDSYTEENAKVGTNSNTSLITNLKVRQTGMRMRNEAFEQCMQTAGFTRRQ